MSQLPEKKNKGGRPPIQLNIPMFEDLCASLHTQEEICALLEISKTGLDGALKRHYGKGFKDVYEIYSSRGKSSIRRAQLKKGIQQLDTRMLIHLGEQYLAQHKNIESATQINIGLAAKEALEFIEVNATTRDDTKDQD